MAKRSIKAPFLQVGLLCSKSDLWQSASLAQDVADEGLLCSKSDLWQSGKNSNMQELAGLLCSKSDLWQSTTVEIKKGLLDCSVRKVIYGKARQRGTVLRVKDCSVRKVIYGKAQPSILTPRPWIALFEK